MQIQGLDLPQIQLVRKITSDQLGRQPLPGREMEYVRWLSSDGDSLEVQGLIDRASVDQLFGISDVGVIWVTDPTLGNFHAIIEVEATWVAGDSAASETTS
jgi:hypothetical protein